jgi:prepilin-type N-terminal cleavage/methylation domain-containing protein/prepilin-type processing-associated H-X9-DG protein
MTRRPAFTLVELLVVVAILAVLAGLLLAGVQKVRAAAARAACGNNARQTALGLHHHLSQRNALPAGLSGPRTPHPYMTWMTRLLPFVEQSAAWDEAAEDYARNRHFHSPPHRNLGRPMPVFRCPAEPRAVGTDDYGVPVGFTHFLGVSGSHAYGTDGVLFLDSAVRPAEVTDGLSQTAVFGERPPSSDDHFGWWYAGVGMHPDPRGPYDGSADSVLAVRETNRTYRAPTCRRGPYPFAPGRGDDMCSTFHFWSRHPGGAHFAFGDGSVRFLAYTADDVLPALASRNGGE